MAMTCEVWLLGGFRVAVGGTAVPDDAWRHRRGADLVKLLALAPGRRLHREQVMDALWPDLPVEASAANLRKATHCARRALGWEGSVGSDAKMLTLFPGAEVHVDAERFEAAAGEALRRGEERACAEAAGRYRGELLPEDRYVLWTQEPRERLRLRYLQVLKAGRMWERVLELDAADEEAHRALIQDALSKGERRAAIRSMRRTPALAPFVFDAHLCLAEFSLHGVEGWEEMGPFARELLDLAERAGSVQGRALATLLLGEGELLAGRLLQRALRLAESSPLAPHLLVRVHGTMVTAASDLPRSLAAIRRADAALAGRDVCPPCSMAFRVAATVALARAGDLRQARARLDGAERIAGLWQGGPWLAAVWEARGVLRRAEGDHARATALFKEAAEQFARARWPVDEARCRAAATISA
jgi:DNA-binding SARP family transcriptional activator